jgi:hypothetical protein
MTTAQTVSVGDKVTAAGHNAVVADLASLGDIQSGSLSVTINAGTAFGFATVSFSPAFASSPSINTTIVTSVIGTGFLASTIVTALSATSFTVRLTLSSAVGSTINPSVQWIARAV